MLDLELTDEAQTIAEAVVEEQDEAVHVENRVRVLRPVEVKVHVAGDGPGARGGPVFVRLLPSFGALQFHHALTEFLHLPLELVYPRLLWRFGGATFLWRLGGAFCWRCGRQGLGLRACRAGSKHHEREHEKFTHQNRLFDNPKSLDVYHESRLRGYLGLLLTVVLTLVAPCARVDAQTKWEIIDNSFLVEEAFNQDAGVVQNIFTWTRNRDGTWDGSFTQEWPARGVKHQVSYTVPFSSTGQAAGIGDVLLNYRFQLREETGGGPAISPRLSVILPTGREADRLGSGTAGLQVNLPVSKQFGNIYVHVNAEYTWLPGVEHTPEIAGSGVWRVAPMFNLMLEGIEVFNESQTLSPGFRTGWIFGKKELVIGVAIPITRADGRTTAAVLTYVSYELPFR